MLHWANDNPADFFLASFGVGLRWQVARNLSVRFDYGWQLTDSGFSTRNRSSRAHVGVTVSF